MLTRDKALELVKEYTTNKNLIKHMYAVESAMEAYAKRLGEDVEKYKVVGLVHDFDYEKMKDQHPSDWGYEILRKNGADEDIIDAIKGHALREDVTSRKNNLARALFAVDELTGFIVAYALMKPNQLSDIDADSIIKKFKDKGFAKGVNRDDIYQGASELGIDIKEHVEIVLNSMLKIKEILELR